MATFDSTSMAQDLWGGPLGRVQEGSQSTPSPRGISPLRSKSLLVSKCPPPGRFPVGLGSGKGKRWCLALPRPVLSEAWRRAAAAERDRNDATRRDAT